MGAFWRSQQVVFDLVPFQVVTQVKIRAVELADMLIQSWKSLGTVGLNLGLAYETRARVALAMKEQQDFATYARLCAEHYRAKRNPALAAKYARLIHEAEKAGMRDIGGEKAGWDIGHGLDLSAPPEDVGGEGTLLHRRVHVPGERGDGFLACGYTAQQREIEAGPTHPSSGDPAEPGLC